jgi:hypothetical protein
MYQKDPVPYQNYLISLINSGVTLIQLQMYCYSGHCYVCI